jgi:hypothetical protein
MEGDDIAVLFTSGTTGVLKAPCSGKSIGLYILGSVEFGGAGGTTTLVSVPPNTLRGLRRC